MTGWGTINGRMAYVYAKDFTVLGGSTSETHAQKICKIMDMAMQNGAPVIGLFDSGGARIQEGVAALAGFGEIFKRNVLASGVVPQISVIMGPCAGGDVYSPALTDFVFMVEGTSYMFITGPEVTRTVTHENVTPEELGGSRVHTVRSSVADGAYGNDIVCLEEIRRLYDFLPLNNRASAPHWPVEDDPRRLEMSLDTLIPENGAQPYDMMELISKVSDEGDFFEIGRAFAPNIITGFGRVEGSTVGFVANQPIVLAGVLDSDASRKAARFVRFCDCFNIPLGHFRGCARLHARHGAGTWRHHQAWRQASVCLCRGHGTQGHRHHPQGIWRRYDVMASKHMRADVNCLAQRPDRGNGAEGRGRVHLPPAKSPEAIPGRMKEYEERFLNPFTAASRGYIDDVIRPHSTRWRIARALRMLKNKQVAQIWKKHDNIPL